MIVDLGRSRIWVFPCALTRITQIHCVTGSSLFLMNTDCIQPDFAVLYFCRSLSTLRPNSLELSEGASSLLQRFFNFFAIFSVEKQLKDLPRGGLSLLGSHSLQPKNSGSTLSFAFLKD
jgi:hypothetical protein